MTGDNTTYDVDDPKWMHFGDDAVNWFNYQSMEMIIFWCMRSMVQWLYTLVLNKIGIDIGYDVISFSLFHWIIIIITPLPLKEIFRKMLYFIIIQNFISKSLILIHSETNTSSNWRISLHKNLMIFDQLMNVDKIKQQFINPNFVN